MSCGLSVINSELPSPRVFLLPLLLATLPSTSQGSVKKFTYRISSSTLRAEARKLAWCNVVEMWGPKAGDVIDEFHFRQRFVAPTRSKQIYNSTLCSKISKIPAEITSRQSLFGSQTLTSFRYHSSSRPLLTSSLFSSSHSKSS